MPASSEFTALHRHPLQKTRIWTTLCLRVCGSLVIQRPFLYSSGEMLPSGPDTVLCTRHVPSLLSGVPPPPPPQHRLYSEWMPRPVRSPVSVHSARPRIHSCSSPITGSSAPLKQRSRRIPSCLLIFTQRVFPERPHGARGSAGAERGHDQGLPHSPCVRGWYF